MSTIKRIFIIAGPNGSGKTTTALSLLPDLINIYEFINADEIARKSLDDNLKIEDMKIWEKMQRLANV